mmetsp:Transcript_12959/g.37359  ORF Transcript_12959/g.37359 Transcript_12959/m.37359 type:complete len:207 (-) Transcript_12959:13-633(-)
MRRKARYMPTKGSEAAIPTAVFRVRHLGATAPWTASCMGVKQRKMPTVQRREANGVESRPVWPSQAAPIQVPSPAAARAMVGHATRGRRWAGLCALARAVRQDPSPRSARASGSSTLRLPALGKRRMRTHEKRTRPTRSAPRYAAPAAASLDRRPLAFGLCGSSEARVPRVRAVERAVMMENRVRARTRRWHRTGVIVELLRHPSR